MQKRAIATAAQTLLVLLAQPQCSYILSDGRGKPLGCAQGAAVDVFSSVANAQGLRHLNLYQNGGITGPMVPPLSAGGGALCQMVKRSLTSLTADGVGLTGTVPSCLVASGSKLVELHLGARALACCAQPPTVAGVLMRSYLIASTTLLKLKGASSCTRAVHAHRSFDLEGASSITCTTANQRTLGPILSSSKRAAAYLRVAICRIWC